MDNHYNRRCDGGFSLAQILVAMVIIGVLSVAVGLTTFSLIGESRETVLANNVRTAAQAVNTSLSLDPGLYPPAARTSVSDGDGVIPQNLLDELGRIAAFNWQTTTELTATTAHVDNWLLVETDDVEDIRIQAIVRSNAGTPAVAAAATGANGDDTRAPVVDWLRQTGGAIRLHARNGDGAWACALIVLNPVPDAARVQGVWYEAGAIVTNDGIAHCDPVGTLAVADTGTSLRHVSGTGDPLVRAVPAFN